jgi:hypothetical protein
VAAEKYRLLSTAFSLARFSVAELAQAAKVNQNTAASWVKRNKQFLQRAGHVVRRNGAGRPAIIWLLRPGSAPAIRTALNELYSGAMRDAEGNIRETGDARNIENAEQYLERWRVAEKAGSPGSAERAKVTAQISIRNAWRRFAELDAAGVTIPDGQLTHLAQLEHQIGAGNLPHTQPLPEFVRWLSQRLDDMSQQGATDEFAVEVTTTRARLRSEASLSVLTAAALAAPIWLEEGLLIDASRPASAHRYSIFLRRGNPDRMVSATALVLNELRNTSCPEPEQRQALVLGLVRHAERLDNAFQEKSIHHFLAYLRFMSCWGNELAPPLVRGLIRGAGSNSNYLVSVLQPALEAALRERWSGVSWKQEYWEPGETRLRTFEFGQRVLENYPLKQGLVHTLENLAIRERDGTLEDTNSEEIGLLQNQLTRAFGVPFVAREAA